MSSINFLSFGGLRQAEESALAEIFVGDDNAEIANAHRPRPVFGSGKGQMWIADDFDAPLDELKEYME